MRQARSTPGAGDERLLLVGAELHGPADVGVLGLAWSNASNWQASATLAARIGSAASQAGDAAGCAWVAVSRAF